MLLLRKHIVIVFWGVHLTNSPRKPATQARRESTEDRILDAFETVLCKRGIRNLSINAIVDEAGVGKPLLYRYFGDLPGLVRAWGERRGAFLDPFPPEGPGEERFDDLKDLLQDDLIKTGEHLRNNPVTLAFLAEELVGKNDVSKAFNDVRALTRKASMKRLLRDPRYLEPDNRGLILIVYAAMTYLALRSKHAPSFFNIDLSTEEGWEDINGLIGGIFENARLAAQMHASVRANESL